MTFAGDFVIAENERATGPFGIVGAGLQRITETPERSAELGPFVEISAGVARSFNTTTVGLEARCQLAAASSDLPRWMLPIGISLRFF
jgi:hypothetical protein